MGSGGWGGLAPRLLWPYSPQRLPSGKVGFSKAMSNKWIRVDKSTADGPRVFRVVSCTQGAGLRMRTRTWPAASHANHHCRWTAWRTRCGGGSSWSRVGRRRSWVRRKGASSERGNCCPKREWPPPAPIARNLCGPGGMRMTRAVLSVSSELCFSRWLSSTHAGFMPPQGLCSCHEFCRELSSLKPGLGIRPLPVCHLK